MCDPAGFFYSITIWTEYEYIYIYIWHIIYSIVLFPCCRICNTSASSGNKLTMWLFFFCVSVLCCIWTAMIMIVINRAVWAYWAYVPKTKHVDLCFAWNEISGINSVLLSTLMSMMMVVISVSLSHCLWFDDFNSIKKSCKFKIFQSIKFDMNYDCI